MGRVIRYSDRDEALEVGVLVSGRTFTARVSREALEDHFGAAGGTADALIDAYKRNARVIDRTAEAKIRNGDPEPVLLRSLDF